MESPVRRMDMLTGGFKPGWKPDPGGSSLAVRLNLRGFAGRL